MRSLLRLLAAAIAAYLVTRQFSALPYWALVLSTFVAAGIAAAIVREIFSPPPRAILGLVPDIVTPIVLAVLMLLAVRAFGHSQQPTSVIPALVWPFVDLWRPLRRGGSH